MIRNKGKMFRCWSITCSVWYFSGIVTSGGLDFQCPSCRTEGIEVSPQERTIVRTLWDEY